MKHIQWIAMACLAGFSAFALRPGDPAEELMVKWIQGGPVAVLPSKNPDPEAPEYKAVVFLLTRAANRDETLNLLGYLNRIHAGKVRFAVVTPDRETDAAAMLRERPDFKLPVAVDTDRKITSQYMSGCSCWRATGGFRRPRRWWMPRSKRLRSWRGSISLRSTC